ncbi:DNA recombination protein RmuC [Novosphingobium umbonatum]|uniref:DNA recombination protein RmuC homolog n=1 Tax=Novosphingobium umbonatum TaxID=1908524 RepID=A0A437N9A8_9SPHN|nr:DNA recombination protein RmuC [Novosphingobium umbonatum]RVU06500.1 DNA recombination protein RmuC [Novosphingobium umbonatum]
MFVLALIVVALVFGFVGYRLGGQPVGEWRQRVDQREADLREVESRLRELDERFRAAITELAGAEERASRSDILARSLGEAQQEREQLRAELARVMQSEDDLRAHVGRLREVDEKFRRAISELATAEERALHADKLAQQVAEMQREREQLHAELAHMKAQAEHFAEQQKLLLEAQDKLKREFENAGAKVLAQAQEQFLSRAEARFAESEKTSAERIKTVLAPVGERLQAYEQQVAALERTRADSFGQLTGLINSMREGQEKVREEAARLGNSLRNAPKARGRWGEQQLRNVLEQCGLAEHTDFVTEHSIDTDEGRLRPDAIVNIPGQKKLVIDAKVSLNAYQEAFEAQDDTARDLALAAHVASMRNHVQTLGTKSYQSQFEDAPDYVVMFVPGEHFVAAALEKDPELWDYAFRNKVLLATPTNLVAIARTVAQVWRQDKLAQEAREIGKLGGELYDRLGVAVDHLKRMGSGLSSTVDNYNKFVGSFERNVMSAGRRLRDKGVEIGKRELEDVPLVDNRPRHDVPLETPALPWPDGE